MTGRHHPTGLRALATRLARKLGRAWRMHSLRVRIHQLLVLRSRPDLWNTASPLQRDLLEARLAELRCELHSLQLQQGGQP